MKFNYCELFLSICGEGSEIFKPAVFVRASGCNMRCEYPCDTEYCFDKIIPIEVSDLVRKIREFNCPTVFLTGGEITLQREALEELVGILSRDTYHIIIQTNGTSFNSNVFYKCDMISLDVKGPSAGINNISDDIVIYKTVENFADKKTVQLKFLVRDEADYNFMKRKINQYRANMRLFHLTEIIIGPVGGIDAKDLIEKVKQDNDLISMRNIRVGAQIHKFLWGNIQGV
jgi:7-carboxy-7-deazaguanine synthase